ncbi:cytochrome c/c1 heme lyase-domain-containing protein [Roridomyces roridus]|uniref:Holocytochrome c-type synthase n=1 Tax=Roridomyces roridus TaxID=1738132 RepID=A0AAD7FKP1_9AGAR|nr:cytochrome c/c1 heme lyase-domain-containing protein [Roridomyces roridus]
MGQTSSQTAPRGPTTSSQGCPIDHKSSPTASACPVPHDAPPKPAQCPIDHETINSLNQMPDMSQQPSSSQSVALPTARTESSIPRDPATKWEYPSPQQFYNAIARKGRETPEELAHVEMMVEIHNFLNEQAWHEVVKWEKRAHSFDDIQLARFKGRPGEMSPKARFWLFAGWLMPSRFNTDPPFDRHDWVVRRPQTGEEVRYVIDYYSAPPEPDGSPDSFGSVKERIFAATEEVWTGLRENNRNPETTTRPQRS